MVTSGGDAASKYSEIYSERKQVLPMTSAANWSSLECVLLSSTIRCVLDSIVEGAYGGLLGEGKSRPGRIKDVECIEHEKNLQGQGSR